jgi:hypothetical protein
MFLGPELAIRLYHGEVFAVESLLPQLPERTAKPRAEYDPQLGWVPAKGSIRITAEEAWTVGEDGLRSNGSGAALESSLLTDAPILAIGDSLTFGDEVLDHETWAAQLEVLKEQPVLNAGVFAYGVDQAFLRAQMLMPRYHPEVVLFAFFGDDINRAGYSYYSAWKPHFEWINDELVLRNVPVPRAGAPEPRFATLRAAFGYSFLANAVLTRVARRWWYYGTIKKVHMDGETVTVALLRRLDQIARNQGAHLIAVTIGVNGQIGNNARLPVVVKEARRHGIDVLDLAPEVDRLIASGREDMFLERGHYSKSMNGWVARRIAEHIGHPLPRHSATAQ